MDVNPEIEAIAQKYRCDSNDPVFGILEKVIEIRDQISGPVRSLPEVTAKLEESSKLIVDITDAFKKLLELYRAENMKTEELTLKSAQNLIAAGKINVRERFFSGLTGALVGITLAVGIMVYQRFTSLDAKLARAHIGIQIEEVSSAKKKSHRVTLFGPKIMGSGRTEDKLVVEFDSSGGSRL